MKTGILFFDIDGTLVDESSHQIPESAMDALYRARDRGHLLFINTGRCRSFLPDAVNAFPFDGFCCACGAHIEYRGKMLMEAFVSPDDIIHIRELLERYNMYGILQGPQYCWFSQNADGYDSILSFQQVTGKDYLGPKKSINEDPGSMQVNKLVCFRQDDCDYSAFCREAKAHYQVIDLGKNFTEILPLPYTKASCMDYLMNFFRIDRSECYVFGDSPNDLPMLRHVPNSICMGNGHEEVQREAAFVTDPIDRNGLRNAMVHLGLI